MKVAALIIGIDGWERYTLPLVESLQKYAPDCVPVVIDNASKEPYPVLDYVHRTERLCYSAAINTAARIAGDADWYIVLSNDVLCTGRFDMLLKSLPRTAIYGPQMVEVARYTFLGGWCVIIPKQIWKRLGGWDEQYVVSSWEDVDYSYMARAAGYHVVEVANAPFRHLDQRQRFILPEFQGTHERNRVYFEAKHNITR